MKRLWAVLFAFALPGPLWATDIKSVPEIRTDLSPISQNPIATPPGVPNLALPTAVLQGDQAVLPETLTAPIDAAVPTPTPDGPTAAMAPKLEPGVSPSAEPQQPQAQPESGSSGVESEKTTGDAFFDNAFKSRREVLRELKYNPAAQRKTLLSDPQKGGSETTLISPKGRPERVMKISNKEVISNELFLRGVMENFELFNKNLASPRSVAYQRLWPLQPVLVQERVADAHKSWMGANIPLVQRVALAILAGTFGVHGFNWGAYLDVNWSRSVLVDFEMARAAFEVSNGPLPVGATSFHPWVSPDYFNDMRDFQPALAVWKKNFSKPETQAEIARLERRAGIGEARIAADLKVYESNLAVLEKSLERDIAMGNRDFSDRARRAGLTGAQAEALSAVNRSAHRSPEGGILRDMARWMIRQPSDPKPAFVLSPEEWRRLCNGRRRGLSAADRKALLNAASQGKLTAPPDGKPYSAAEVTLALDRLDFLLKSSRIP